MDMMKKYALFKALESLRFKERSIRELSRKAKIGVGTAKNIVDYLNKNKVLNKKVLGRSHYYKIDLENFFARNIKNFLSLGEINNSNLVEEIIGKYPSVFSIVLYGSVARGDDEQESDIDILIISRKEIKIRQLDAEKRLERELVPSCYTLGDWRKKAKDDKVFYDRIIIEGIVLYGEMPAVN